MDFRVFSQNLPEKMQARCVRKDAEQALTVAAEKNVVRRKHYVRMPLKSRESRRMRKNPAGIKEVFNRM
ncbi:hypothetical protein [Ruminococcus sp.]|uniref:hypothetical protein n=1 Tax=Ruminococcus sp. TaxID=41978 RepID=UPI0025CE9669|nr:hypothetical protein [Ruminococcus sp.]